MTPSENNEQTNPSHQEQEDGYSRGVDLVGMLAGEFGVSRVVVAQQLRDRNVEIRVNGDLYTPDSRFRIPYEIAKDSTIEVVGESLHFKMQFQG